MIIEKCFDICKQYGSGDNRTIALNHVSMEINKGEFIAIVGDSGSGKSTLLNVLGAMDEVTSGIIELNGEVISNLSEAERTIKRREIGFVFQDYNLIPILTVYENIIMTVKIAGGDIDEDYIKELISILELDGLENRMPGQLSGGQQQRVAIARAFAAKPLIIFADEPTGNLDSRTGNIVMDMFRKSVDNFGQTVVMVTHNEIHAELCDTIYYMQDGILKMRG